VQAEDQIHPVLHAPSATECGSIGFSDALAFQGRRVARGGRLHGHREPAAASVREWSRRARIEPRTAEGKQRRLRTRYVGAGVCLSVSDSTACAARLPGRHKQEANRGLSIGQAALVIPTARSDPIFKKKPKSEKETRCGGGVRDFDRPLQSVCLLLSPHCEGSELRYGQPEARGSTSSPPSLMYLIMHGISNT
jgi:hypothetical protein